MQILTVNISYNGDWLSKNCYCQYVGSRLLAFDRYIYIRRWPVLNVKVRVIWLNLIKLSHAACSCIPGSALSFLVATSAERLCLKASLLVGRALWPSRRCHRLSFSRSNCRNFIFFCNGSKSNETRNVFFRYAYLSRQGILRLRTSTKSQK